MDGERHPKDDASVRPYPEKGPLPDDQDPDPNLVDPDPNLLKVEVDEKGKPKVTFDTHGGTGNITPEQDPTKSGPTRQVKPKLVGPRITDDPDATTGPPVTVDPNRMFQLDHEPAHNTPGAANDNREAVEFLRQAVARLAAVGKPEDIVSEIRGVYLSANHLVMGPKQWAPELYAEYEAWEQYAISAAVPEYQIAKETVQAAGTTVAETAWQWWAEQGPTVPIVGNPDLANALLGIGANLRQAITDAMTTVQTTNASALELLRQSVHDLSAATDPEYVIRNAGTVFSMVSHLLHGDAMDPALADEEQAWIATQPADAVATAAKDHLVPAAEEFFQHAHQMVEWYPFHSLIGWDAPVQELLTAGQHARAATTP
jgi:hypothetical protein